MDFYGTELKAFKANLHMHTTHSDGKYEPSEIIRLYQEAGYDAVAFTDHHTTNDTASYDGLGMTLLSGAEIHPVNPRHGNRWHLLCLGVPHALRCRDYSTPQEVIDAVHAAGGLVYCAHPYWNGFGADDVAELQGIDGIEVYNTSCRYIGRDYNMQVWDQLLGEGFRYPALAVDDTHTERDLFHGWTTILAPENTPEALLEALLYQRFYASQGPVIHRLSWKDGVFEADFSPCASVTLVTSRERGACLRLPEDNGPLATSCRFEPVREGLRKWHRYFRLQLQDAQGRYAWSAPVYLKE